MRYLVLGLLLLFIVPVRVWSQERGFRSIPEMNEYIFQNSELDKITNGYFLDLIPQFAPEEKMKLLERLNEDFVDRELLLSLISLMEATSVKEEFNSDELLFPIFDQYYYNNGSSQVKIPIIIGDIDFSHVTSKTYYEVFLKHNGTRPFNQLRKEDIENKNVAIIGAFADTLINNNVHIFWNKNTVFSNTNRRIEKVELIIGDNKIIIPENEMFPLAKLYSESDPLRNITFAITFDNRQEIKKKSNAVFVKDKNYSSNTNNQKSGTSDCEIDWNNIGNNQTNDNFEIETIGGDMAVDLGGVNIEGHFADIPDLDVTVLWGCDNGVYNKVLDKPYIIVGGWGPYTNNLIINNNQNWPSSVVSLYNDFNVDGLIDELVGAGFDVILAKFNPPNFKVHSNSIQLEKLINCVNQEKFSNGSYQENIISGYSAGAMCVRLTLEMMEKKHLDNTSNPHHHSKLFISMDGEHGGANVPLGIQHSVDYLRRYHTPIIDPVFNLPNLTIYALHYILNASLSKELLKYFHTETGGITSPNQGHNNARQLFLNRYDFYNHSKNSHNPGYPTFTRNISISNGTSHRTANSSTQSYHPYSLVDGEKIFEHNRAGLKRWRVNLLGDASNTVFKFERSLLWLWWFVVEEYKTNDPLLIDNTPGGTTFLVDQNDCNDQNIMYQVLRRMEVKTNFLPAIFAKADYAGYEAMFTFTPTAFTHDLRNVDYHSTGSGRRLYYDMKEDGLMYQNISEITDVENASSYFGYPHLAHPTNHYTDYTPFDAVFAWDEQNTIHLHSGKAEWVEKEQVECTMDFMDFIAGEDPEHDRWEQRHSILREEIKNFVSEETDWWDAYILNRKYGWNANENDFNYVYKADIIAKQNIYAGDSVTQRTNFKPVEIRQNADIRFSACESVVLKPGFHAQSGSSFSAEIDTDNCKFCGTQGMIPNGRPIQELPLVLFAEEKEIEEKHFENEVEISIYPNPAKDISYIQVGKEVDFEYQVFNIMGNLVTKGMSRSKVELQLSKGVYIVKLKIDNTWHTRKLIMY